VLCTIRNTRRRAFWQVCFKDRITGNTGSTAWPWGLKASRGHRNTNRTRTPGGFNQGRGGVHPAGPVSSLSIPIRLKLRLLFLSGLRYVLRVRAGLCRAGLPCAKDAGDALAFGDGEDAIYSWKFDGFNGT